MSEYAAPVFLPGFLTEFACRDPEIRYAFTPTDGVAKLVKEGYRSRVFVDALTACPEKALA